MRVKQPEPFDREREYKPGERAIVKGAVLIATLWTPAAQRLADSPGNVLHCPGTGRTIDNPPGKRV